MRFSRVATDGCAVWICGPYNTKSVNYFAALLDDRLLFAGRPFLWMRCPHNDTRAAGPGLQDATRGSVPTLLRDGATEKNIVERAFELAPACSSVDEVRRTLAREGNADVIDP